MTTGTPTQFTVTTAAAGEEIFFEFQTRDAALGPVATAQMRLVTGGIPSGPDLPNAVYWTAPVSILAQDFRGWTHFGYLGEGAAATQPVNITTADLTLSGLGAIDPEDFRDAIEDAIANGGAGPTLGINLRVFPYYPNVLQSRLDGQDADLWASATALSTSRQGRNFIPNPGADAFAGARAVPKISVTEARAFSLSAGITVGPVGAGPAVSQSDANARALLEFRDFNGDQFPDVIASGMSVQFTDQTGGLSGGTESVGGGHPQTSSSDTFSRGLGGTFAFSQANGRANFNQQAGNPPAANGQSGYISASLGLSGDKSESESANQSDLIDVNGDGLPDRVSQGVEAGDNGDRTLTVALNLGYRFGAPEQWGAESRLSEGASKGQSIGGTIGFNIGNFGIAGGVNDSDNESWSLAGDFAGDDRVRLPAQHADASGGVGAHAACRSGSHRIGLHRDVHARRRAEAGDPGQEGSRAVDDGGRDERRSASLRAHALRCVRAHVRAVLSDDGGAGHGPHAGGDVR